jgi:protein SCO1/2
LRAPLRLFRPLIPDMPEIPVDSYRPQKGTVVMIIMVIIALGIVVWWNYYIKVTNEIKQGRLPISGRVEKDPLKWVDQNGKERQLHDLMGKVTVWSYLYTTCPQGCSGLAQEMKALQDEFGSNPKFQLVSVSLYSEFDKPPMLKKWTDAQGFSGENWWFLTSPNGTPEEGKIIRDWMNDTFKIWAAKNDEAHIKENPADVWTHDLVMVLTDDRGNIRTPTNNDTFWYPYHKAFGEWYPRHIREDIKKLLEEAAKH